MLEVWRESQRPGWHGLDMSRGGTVKEAEDGAARQEVQKKT